MVNKGRKVDSRAERLREARKAAGFTSAAEAANRFEWQEAAYRHHENGTRGFGPDVPPANMAALSR
jgi:hypothetical protein